MERFVMEKLVQWKNKKNRKPMIIKGARQVGKTWLMKEFGHRYFKYTAYVNFEKKDFYTGKVPKNAVKRAFFGTFCCLGDV
ncbi:MAG: AAA family ATPase [Lachnospiraceae bacterium]|nr:AAA family ATPase [Lachnospiraceae bacterium]